MVNYVIDHNTIASVANGQGLAFQRGGTAPDYYLATPWNAGTAYVQTNQVAGSDGNAYQLIVASDTGTNPVGNPATWKLLGSASYENVSITNNYCSGYGIHTHVGPLMTGLRDFVFTDNVYTTDVMWTFGPVYQSDVSRSVFVAANGNSWRRNTLQLYPGSGSSYASHFAAWDGMFIVPTSDETSEAAGYSASDWGDGAATGAF